MNNCVVPSVVRIDIASEVVPIVLVSDNGSLVETDAPVTDIVEPSVVAAVVSLADVNTAEVVNRFKSVVVSDKVSKSSASKICLGLLYDSTVISSLSPREADSELVDKSLVCIFSMNSVEFALRTIFSTVSIFLTDDNNSGRDRT